MYNLKKVWNVIVRLDPEDEDVNVVSFSTRYEAKQFYDSCRKELKDNFSNYDVCEDGSETKGDMIIYTGEGPYVYVRLNSCELLSSCFRNKEYFNH